MPKCKNCTNLYNLSDEDDVIVGKWCPKINDSPHLEIERDCEYYQCMTNADRISAMSVDEMTEFIVSLNDCCLAGTGVVNCRYANCEKDCRRIVKNWLQSEVDEKG